MATFLRPCLFVFLFCTSILGDVTKSANPLSCRTDQECEEDAKQYLESVYEKAASALCNKVTVAEWNYMTDLTNSTKEEALTDTTVEKAKFDMDSWKDHIRNYNYSAFKDPGLRRQLRFLNIVGPAALNTVDLTQYSDILAKMSKIYGTTKVCPYENQECEDLNKDGLSLDPDIEEILASSNNDSQLAYLWEEWHNKVGDPVKELYEEFIILANKAAKANGFDNMGDLWISSYETSDFKEDMKAIWESVEPLYAELHAFVRYKLRKIYHWRGTYTYEDPIPAHLLGNMWGQSWENVYRHVVPHPHKPVFDITEKLQEKFPSTLAGVRGMFEEANGFFTGMGLSDMSVAYGDKALIMKPQDGRKVICHASAFEFCDGQDFRIKMCARVSQKDYMVIHHELGHIQYYMNYRNLPLSFREGANPGFHEAIGDTIALSVSSPRHLESLGYIESHDVDEDTTINFLMRRALEKVAFIPFGYLLDFYRWQLFDGSIPMANAEIDWLKLRNKIQGIIPPESRHPWSFDAGAKYHVVSNTPYIRYFFSTILQFQLHKSLCIAAKQYDPDKPLKRPLYNCDISGNRAAGQILKNLLEKGSSVPWQDVLEEATGSRNLNASALLEYFAPLRKYLIEERLELGYPARWRLHAYENRYSYFDEVSQSRFVDVVIVLVMIFFSILLAIMFGGLCYYVYLKFRER